MNPPASDPILQQFERWTYPPPVQDLSEIDFNSPHAHFNDLRRSPFLFWPQDGLREEIDILVAGCGTNTAPGYAHCYPKARVVGIDISAPSLAHAEKLRARHNLQNLTLRQLPIEQAHTLERTFDLVVVHGVLHHLPDPPAGLASLGRLLKPDGIVWIMVYGRYGRLGVYMLQDLFRLLGLQREQEDVQLVRQALGLLGQRHPAQSYIQSAADLPADAAVVDTFLSGRDRPYTVADCLDLVEQAGLAFAGWDENALYTPDGMVNQVYPLRERFDALPAPLQWQAVELLFGRTGMHFFRACRKDRSPAAYQVRFDSDAFLECVPVRRITHMRPPTDAAPPAIARPPFPPLELTATQARFFDQIDSGRTVRQILEALAPGDPGAHAASAREFLKRLWNVGYIMFRIPAPPKAM